MPDRAVVKGGYFGLVATGGTLVDWSDHVQGVTITRNGNPIVINTFGSDYVQREGGLIDNGLSVDMVHPKDDSFNAQFWDAIGTKVDFEVRRDAGAASIENPSFTGTAVLSSMGVLGSVGDAETFTVDLPVDGEIARLTS